MTERKSIVVTHRPGQRLFFGVLAAMAIVLALMIGRYWGGFESGRIMAEKTRLEDKLAAQANDLMLREGQLNKLLLSSEVDAVALENTRQQMVILQRQIYARDEDLKLYRDLLQDNNAPSGLSVGDFSLTMLDDQRVKYRWVARQKTAKMKLLSVFADVRVEGKKNGDSVTLSLDALDEQVDTMPLKLEFKYFSIQQGIMELPDGFEPATVVVSLRYTWEKKVVLTQDFVWKYEE